MPIFAFSPVLSHAGFLANMLQYMTDTRVGEKVSDVDGEGLKENFK